MSQFAVIGLGRFGRSVCLELMRLGHSVIGVDIEPKLVNPIADELTHAVIADATSEAALEELNLKDCNAVVVAIGENLEASLLCTLHLKTLGVEDIRVKAVTPEHHRILSRLGISQIIHPEEDMGIRVAQALNYPMVNAYISIGHNQYVVEVRLSEKCDGKTIRDIVPESVHCLLLKQGEHLQPQPDVQTCLSDHDMLVLVGDLKSLDKLAKVL